MVLVRALLALWLYVLLLWLGLISLGWNLIAFVIYPLFPRRIGQRVGAASPMATASTGGAHA